jgi:ureidoglycolate lyase/seryl-tRNA synthetase
MQQPIDYLSPDVPAELPWHDVPLLVASDDTVQSYGYLVDDPDDFEIEIVQWPALGWRPIDAGTGDEGGVVEGIFHSEWRGEVLHGHNDAVDGSYTDAPTIDPERVLLWHMNYHPDGGQLFYPLDGQPFVVPAALPGDDLGLDDIVAFWCDGSQGLYIHPGIWHEGVFPATHAQSFRDRQGRVHARVSCNVSQEFGVFLNVPLRRATSLPG